MESKKLVDALLTHKYLQSRINIKVDRHVYSVLVVVYINNCLFLVNLISLIRKNMAICSERYEIVIDNGGVILVCGLHKAKEGICILI